MVSYFQSREIWETGKGCQHQRNGRSQVLSAWASITKYQSCHRLTQHVLVSGGWKSGIKGPARLAPQFVMAAALLGAHMTSSLCRCWKEGEERERVLVSLPRRTLILLDRGPILRTPFNLNYPPRSSSSKTATLSVSASTYESGGDTWEEGISGDFQIKKGEGGRSSNSIKPSKVRKKQCYKIINNSVSQELHYICKHSYLKWKELSSPMEG